MTAEDRDRHKAALTVRQLTAALAVIAMLAFVLPAGAVRMLHGRRLTRVDRDLQLVADKLRSAPRLSADAILSGPGERPRAQDEQWNSVAMLPLARAIAPLDVSADPWGNAYLACGEASPGTGVWVLSAGPDGILQTELHVPRSVPAGDDHGAYAGR